MKRTNKQQIGINFSTKIDDLSGKIVDKVAFCDDPNSEQHFILTFTDGTYISIGLGYSEDDQDYKLESDWVPTCTPENVNNGRLDHWIDSHGNLRFSKWVQDLVDLGIWEVSESEVQDLIKKQKEESEKREYNEYLRLKKKYEKHD